MPPHAHPLVGFFEEHLDWSLGILRQLVLRESPTASKQAVDHAGELVSRCFEEQGAVVERIPQQQVGDHLVGFWHGAVEPDLPPLLLLGHIDTVWPIGQLSRMPWRRDGEAIHGPGVYDMKAGVVLILLCLRAFRDLARRPRRPVKILLTSDEEVGSESSKQVVEETARGCEYVLCLEPPLPGNLAKTFRKGVYHFRLDTFGVAAHAGVDHEKGVNAVEELAHQILRLQAMTDYATGTTVNVGSVHTENASNVVPDRAWAEIDVRASSVRAGEEITQRIQALRPVHPKAEVRVTGGMGRPPLERTDGVLELYRHAAALAREVGFDLGEGSTGGGSDGSLTAAMGIPTLDGMGVAGEGSHSLEEHILVSDIPRKAALLTRIMETR